MTAQFQPFVACYPEGASLVLVLCCEPFLDWPTLLQTEEEDDSTPAKKAKKADDSDDASAATPGKGTRPKCRYWDKCYRKDPAHKKAFRHPGDKGGGKGNGDEEDMDDEPAPPQPKNVMADGAEVNIDNHRIKRIGDHYSCK